MKKHFILFTVLSSIIIPVLSFAQVKTDYIDSLISGGLRITNSLVILLMAFAVVWFIWNVIRYTMSAEDADKTKAKDQMIRGIIALAVIVSIWGLVAILQNMFNTGGKGAPSNLNNMIPGVSSSGGSRSSGNLQINPSTYEPSRNVMPDGLYYQDTPSFDRGELDLQRNY